VNTAPDTICVENVVYTALRDLVHYLQEIPLSLEEEGSDPLGEREREIW
jgi:hypothetical protein